MSKYEQEKISPEEKEIAKQVRKIKQDIEEERKTTNEVFQTHLDEKKKELNRKGIEISREELLARALELLREDWRGLPEELEKEFLELELELEYQRITKKIVEEWTPGEEDELHELLRKYVVEAKRQGIDLNGEEIEKRVREL